MFLNEQYFMGFCEGEEEKESQSWTEIPIDASTSSTE